MQHIIRWHDAQLQTIMMTFHNSLACGPCDDDTECDVCGDSVNACGKKWIIKFQQDEMEGSKKKKQQEESSATIISFCEDLNGNGK